ncbi:hypothetical protein EVAR_20063_1 [Eumeta japonica]|uniref:Uncharacterized protein n=1 Tax=Eumeta variegata TaxID=151549 RepID=A0A4C1UI98_EUMVA|nr:hypothetical protein EVAR_20063_1 [Eumeta japonica]
MIKYDLHRSSALLIRSMTCKSWTPDRFYTSCRMQTTNYSPIRIPGAAFYRGPTTAFSVAPNPCLGSQTTSRPRLNPCFASAASLRVSPQHGRSVCPKKSNYAKVQVNRTYSFGDLMMSQSDATNTDVQLVLRSRSGLLPSCRKCASSDSQPVLGPPAAPSPRPSPCFGPTVVPGPYYGPMGGHHAPNPCFGPAPTRRPGACFASAASLRVSPQHCSTQPRRFDPCFL